MNSQNELTQELKNKIPDLIKILRNSKSILARDLSKAIGTDERQLRLIVSYARQNVSPLIVSGNFGYRWETDKDKVLDTIKRTTSHAISEIKTCNKQKKLLREEYGYV